MTPPTPTTRKTKKEKTRRCVHEGDLEAACVGFIEKVMKAEFRVREC